MRIKFNFLGTIQLFVDCEPARESIEVMDPSETPKAQQRCFYTWFTELLAWIAPLQHLWTNLKPSMEHMILIMGPIKRILESHISNVFSNKSGHNLTLLFQG